jgi:hypothetical protein
VEKEDINSDISEAQCQNREVWKVTERKEGHLDKEQVQEIVLSGIVVKDESTDKNK